MNRRGLMRMLGLAPLVPVAAVVPAFEPGGGIAVEVTASPYFDAHVKRIAARDDLRTLTKRLDEKLSKYERAMKAAQRVAFDTAGDAYQGAGRLLEPHYWGA